MNRERAKQLLPILQAFAEGKTIQKRLHSDQDWVDQVGPDLDLNDNWQVRIKPAPREFWITDPHPFDRTDVTLTTNPQGFTKRDEIEGSIKVREVLDD